MDDGHNSKVKRFLELLRPIERDLELFCRRLAFNSQDVPDAIQNAVLRAFQAFDRYHDDSSFRAWMLKILTNEIFTINRKRGRIEKFEIAMDHEKLENIWESAHAEEFPYSESALETVSNVLDSQLIACLDNLNQLERAVLLLRAIGGLRYREIGEALDIPIGSVMGNLSRARKKMRDAIVRSGGG